MISSTRILRRATRRFGRCIWTPSPRFCDAAFSGCWSPFSPLRSDSLVSSTSGGCWECRCPGPSFPLLCSVYPGRSCKKTRFPDENARSPRKAFRGSLDPNILPCDPVSRKRALSASREGAILQERLGKEHGGNRRSTAHHVPRAAEAEQAGALPPSADRRGDPHGTHRLSRRCRRPARRSPTPRATRRHRTARARRPPWRSRSFRTRRRRLRGAPRQRRGAASPRSNTSPIRPR